MPSAAAHAPALEARPPEGNAAVYAITGRLDAYSVAPLWRTAHRELTNHSSQPIIFDAAGVDYADGAGIALLVEVQRHARDANAAVSVRNLPEQYGRLLEQFDPKRFVSHPAPAAPHVSITERVGRVGANVLRGALDRVSFIGECAVGLVDTLLHPSRLRWQDTFVIAERAGGEAVPIVMLIGFLMGVILAFQSAIPMRQFGAEIYVANLVALSLLRELGPLMTAILLAGRSGSAFAAEIGTMKVNEEVNALITMGIDPVRFLVVPRLLAATLMCPLLTLLADLIGLVGGALVMRSFGIPFVTYLHQVDAAASHGDLLGGLLKAVFFGLLVAGVGCWQGLKTGQGPSAVGQSTTRAVVGGIILIVAADGLFAVLFHVLDI